MIKPAYILGLMLFASTVSGIDGGHLDRLSALSMLESGDNDLAHGRSGEVSRFQMLKSVWKAHTRLPLAQATNAITAQSVAVAVMKERVAGFIARHHREPTDAEFYKTWNPRCPDETAQRFANLCKLKYNNTRKELTP